MVSRILVPVFLMLGLTGGARAVTLGTSSAPASWQHHRTTLQYLGITSKYSCDGLEDQVRRLLLYFGARSDLSVHARGCSRGAERPSDSAWVDVDFFSLVPATDGDTAAASAQWTPIVVQPRRPLWMDYGECELMDQMRKILTQNFALRALDYRADCFPHDISIADYSVKAEVLRARP